jgi:hypothetical protein
MVWTDMAGPLLENQALYGGKTGRLPAAAEVHAAFTGICGALGG